MAMVNQPERSASKKTFKVRQPIFSGLGFGSDHLNFHFGLRSIMITEPFASQQSPISSAIFLCRCFGHSTKRKPLCSNEQPTLLLCLLLKDFLGFMSQQQHVVGPRSELGLLCFVASGLTCGRVPPVFGGEAVGDVRVQPGGSTGRAWSAWRRKEASLVLGMLRLPSAVWDPASLTRLR